MRVGASSEQVCCYRSWLSAQAGVRPLTEVRTAQGTWAAARARVSACTHVASGTSNGHVYGSKGWWWELALVVSRCVATGASYGHMHSSGGEWQVLGLGAFRCITAGASYEHRQHCMPVTWVGARSWPKSSCGGLGCQCPLLWLRGSHGRTHYSRDGWQELELAVCKYTAAGAICTCN